ncbi:MAG: hypothetical protein AB7V42_15685 [Thermoleophilia bacterium]
MGVVRDDGRKRRPAVAALILAPVLGEGLSAASPPIAMLWPPALVMLVSLYGCGALLCREIARRRGLGLGGLCLLAAAYAVFEEALVDRFWFHPRPPDEGGLGTYGEVWHTNVLLATNLTVFHIAVSVVSTIVLVELCFPEHRHRPWVGRRGLRCAAAAFIVLPPLLYGEYSLDPLPQLAAAAVLMVALVLVAVRLPGRPSLWESRAATSSARRGVAPAAFAAAAANLLLMGLSDVDAPWPLAVVAVLTPVALAFLFIRTRVSGPVFGRDGLRVVSGVLGFYCLFAMGIGLAGQFDLTLFAVAVVVLLGRLRRRVRGSLAAGGA